jgi:DNA-binding transcriptional regulator GbsR (MarR family)
MSDVDLQTLTPTQQALVDEFGNIYESYGLKRVKGLIVGLLLTQPDPVSLDDMATLLNRSKGPISSAVRELSSIQLARKVNGPKTRRDYYVAHPDIFYNNFKFNMATVRRNRTLAADFLARFREEDAEAHADTIRHLEHMKAFYTLMESFYQDFSAKWEQARTDLNLPS